MKEIQNIIAAYDQLNLSKTRAALATVVHVDGSSYRRTGARMLILDNGTWIGGISGGCLEGDALRKAKHAILQNKPSLVVYDTRDEDAHQIGIGLGCNGLIEVLITPLSEKNSQNPIEILRSCTNDRQASTLLTLAKTTDENLEQGLVFKLEKERNLFEKLKNKALCEALATDIILSKTKQKSATKTYQINNHSYTFFIEILPPALHLVIYGGNYDIYPLVDIAKKIGWNVSVVANPTKVAKSLFTVADEVISNRDCKVSFDEFSAVVLMAHDYKTDKNNFLKLVKKEIPYLGILGPMKRTQKMYDEAKEQGIDLTETDFARIHAPIGLDTGAITPEEISVAILAEIRAYFSKRNGGFLKNRKGTIHERT